MKVGILAESPVDAMGIQILAEAVLATRMDRIRHPPIEARGWPNVRSVVPAVFASRHFNSNAYGFIVVVDADNSVVHQAHHEAQPAAYPDCRLCELKTIIASKRSRLRARPHLPELRIAVGLAVPAIEAWYRI